MPLTNKRLDDTEFFKERREVLSTWKTGKEVDLDEAIAYHKSMPRKKNMAYKIEDAKKMGEMLLTSDMGHTTIKQEIELLQYIQDEGRSDILGTMVDSFTRTLQFEAAEREVKKAEETNQNLLNGFPIVTHGVKGTRQVIDAVNLPVRLRYVTTKAKLLNEIGLAGGHTYTEGCPILCFMNYSQKTETFESVIREYQYIFRLVGCYEERGVPIVVHSIGGNHLPGATPSSLLAALTIINLLMQPAQGVKHVWLNGSSVGNLAQDIAYCISLPKLAAEYLKKLGYKDVIIFTGGAEIAGRYPLDEAQAFAEVLWSPIVSALAGVDVCLIKTVDEAQTIPNKKYAAYSLKGTKMLLNMFKGQKFDVTKNQDVLAESEIFEKEVRAVVDKTLDFGDGDPVVGAIKAVDAGVIDHPFATNQHIHTNVMGIRDASKAVRYFETGDLPFTKDIVDFNKQKVAEREKLLGKKVTFDTVVEDMLTLSQGLE